MAQADVEKLKEIARIVKRSSPQDADKSLKAIQEVMNAPAPTPPNPTAPAAPEPPQGETREEKRGAKRGKADAE